VASNPFSTRFIRPGAIGFLFQDGDSAASLVDRLREQNWWGQIVGEHGSGKSTLLATLMPVLEVAARRVISITLHQGERRLPTIDRNALKSDTQLVIDGYEQLSWWARWRVKSLCARSGAGLLVTGHRDLGLPTIYRTETSQKTAQAVVSQLLGDDASLITTSDVAAAYGATGGNIRETLFRLYDVHQTKGSLRQMSTDVGF
jgi:ABC-type dipeptide/oligopeptide/nickel transport system ATPase component